MTTLIETNDDRVRRSRIVDDLDKASIAKVHRPCITCIDRTVLVYVRNDIERRRARDLDPGHIRAQFWATPY